MVRSPLQGLAVVVNCVPGPALALRQAQGSLQPGLLHPGLSAPFRVPRNKLALMVRRLMATTRGFQPRFVFRFDRFEDFTGLKPGMYQPGLERSEGPGTRRQILARPVRPSLRAIQGVLCEGLRHGRIASYRA